MLYAPLSYREPLNSTHETGQSRLPRYRGPTGCVLWRAIVDAEALLDDFLPSWDDMDWLPLCLSIIAQVSSR